MRSIVLHNVPPFILRELPDRPGSRAMPRLLICLSMAALFWASGLAAQEARSGTPGTSKITGDWTTLFKTHPVSISPTQVQVTDMTGTDVNDKTWTVVHTKYFDLHYQPTSDREKVKRLARSVDSIYIFLQGRLGVERPTPIKAFLIPDVVGHSVNYPKLNMVLTGDAGDYVLNMGSLLHECTHLFAHQYLEHGRRSKWTGEYMCHYLQARLRLMERGVDFKQQYRGSAAHRPLPSLSVLDGPGDSPDYSAAAMLYYFLEDRYGADKLNDFWRARLDADGRAPARDAFDAPFEKVFNKTAAELEEEWRAYWGQAHAPPKAPERGGKGNQ